MWSHNTISKHTTIDTIDRRDFNIWQTGYTYPWRTPWPGYCHIMRQIGDCLL